MSSRFKSAYYLNLSKEGAGSYPKIEHDRIDEIDEWDTRDWKKIKEHEDGEYGRDMRVVKYMEYETLLGKRILLKIRSSIIADISKFGDEYYLYRVAGTVVEAQKDNIKLDDVYSGNRLNIKTVVDSL